jgi:trk system potassium uptake protein TrkA
MTTKQKTVLIIGLGPMGASLVEELWDTNVEIVVIDRDPLAVDAVKERAHAALVADATDQTVLEGVASRDLRAAIVTHGEDFEAAVLTVSTLAQLRVPTIIARAKNERQAAVLRAVGATRVVLVEREMGRRLAPEVLSPAASELMEQAAAFRVVPWPAAGAVVGRTLAELDLPRRFEVTVLGFWRGGDRDAGPRRRLTPPTAEYRIEGGDTLLLIGLATAVERFLAED